MNVRNYNMKLVLSPLSPILVRSSERPGASMGFPFNGVHSTQAGGLHSQMGNPDQSQPYHHGNTEPVQMPGGQPASLQLKTNSTARAGRQSTEEYQQQQKFVPPPPPKKEDYDRMQSYIARNENYFNSNQIPAHTGSQPDAGSPHKKATVVQSTIHHVDPRSVGGNLESSNLVEQRPAFIFDSHI